MFRNLFKIESPQLRAGSIILIFSFIFSPFLPLTVIGPKTAEAATSFSTTLKRPTNNTGLVAWWTLDGRLATTGPFGVIDSSGNGKHGSMQALASNATETYTTPGLFTWIAPTGVTNIIGEVWAGGGGGGGRHSTNDGSGGGGGGAYSSSTVSVTPGNSYSFYVGAGGAGGVASSTGASGEDSMFYSSTTVLAKGGTGGHYNNGTGGRGDGGAGGQSASGFGTAKISGGNGGNGRDNNTGTGGGGGEGACTTGTGGNGSAGLGSGGIGGNSCDGGNGGTGGNTGSNGVGGTAIGGGGGGAGDNSALDVTTNGGAGGSGQVVLSYVIPSHAKQVSARLGQGLQFYASVGTYVSLGNVNSSVQSISFWMRLSTSTVQHHIIDLNGSAYISMSNGTLSANGFSSPTIYVDGVVSSTVNNFEWHYVTVTTASSINASAAELGHVGTDYFGGSLDDVRFYNRELSAGDVTAHFKQGTANKLGASLVGGTTLENGLVGWWTFDGPDMLSNVRDRSGQGNNGNLSGQISTTTVAGKIGQALSFDGSNDYINLPTSMHPYNSTATYSAWFKANTNSGRASIFSHESDSSANFSGILCGGIWLSGTTLKGELYDNSAYQGLSSTITTSEWHHATFVKNMESSTVQLYVDGEYIGQDTFNTAGLGIVSGTNYCDSNFIKIGRVTSVNVSGPDGYFNGSIDDVRIYNRALSQSEITDLYNLGAATKVAKSTVGGSGLQNGLVGYWTFDGPDMLQNVRDKSGQGNNGTLSLSGNGTTTIAGKLGQALSFDGSTRVSLGNPVTLQLLNGTMSAWIKTSNAGTGHHAIVGKQNAYGMFLYSNEFVMYSWGSPSGNKASGIFLNDNKWHYVVCAFQSGVTNGSSCYVDGSLAITTTMSVSGQATGVYIGEANASQYFNGTIDDVRIYDRVLSASEVLQLYNLGR